MILENPVCTVYQYLDFGTRISSIDKTSVIKEGEPFRQVGNDFLKTS
jgi:hypothetical protein